MADVESGDRVRTELGELDGEIARARRDLEHGATGRELAADSQRELCEFVERLASVGRVPLRDHAFHAYVLTSFGQCRGNTTRDASHGPGVQLKVRSGIRGLPARPTQRCRLTPAAELHRLREIGRAHV